MSIHPVIAGTLEKTQTLAMEVAAEMGIQDMSHAYQLGREFLVDFVQQVTIEDALEIASQLPALVRERAGGLSPGAVWAKRGEVVEFLQSTIAEMNLVDELRAEATSAAGQLARRVAVEQAGQVLDMLPGKLRTVVGAALGM